MARAFCAVYFVRYGTSSNWNIKQQLSRLANFDHMVSHMQYKHCTQRKRRLFHTIIARALLHINRFSWSFDFLKRSAWLRFTSNWLQKRVNFSPKNISNAQYEHFIQYNYDFHSNICSRSDKTTDYYYINTKTSCSMYENQRRKHNSPLIQSTNTC